MYLQYQNHFLVSTYVVYAITLHHGPIFYDTAQGSGMLLYCCKNPNKSHANEHLNEHYIIHCIEYLGFFKK